MTVNIGLGRSYGRGPEEKRPTKITRHFLDNVPGSCLIETGATKVLCAVSIEERVKAWRKGAGAGWITAEYAMLPASTAKRSSREHLTRKGRSMEIERLIGRSLRSAVDMTGLGGEVTFTVDCDVLQADGGTRTAAITGAWVALHDALEMWQNAGKIKASPIIDQVAAISVGQVDGRILLDLDYQEDSRAEVEARLSRSRALVSAARLTVRSSTRCSMWQRWALRSCLPNSVEQLGSNHAYEEGRHRDEQRP